MRDGLETRNDEVFSKAVRAGKRTYFFDIKSTRGNDLYLTITESKKKPGEHQNSFEKHKLFLYKEDFEKFSEGLHEVLAKIDELRQSGEFESSVDSAAYSEVEFDDLA
jgi:hypothetical protein